MSTNTVPHLMRSKKTRLLARQTTGRSSSRSKPSPVNKFIDQNKPDKELKPKSPTLSYGSSLQSGFDWPEQVYRVTRLRAQKATEDKGRRPKRARLTRKNLARLDKMARAKGTKKASASASSEHTSEPKSTEFPSLPSSFAMKAQKNGLFTPPSSKPPVNSKHIRERYACSRGTTSPTKTDYQAYIGSISGQNEAGIAAAVNARLLKQYNVGGYHKAFKRALTGFPKNIGFNNALPTPRPDFIEGFWESQYCPFPIKDVQGAVLHEDNSASIALPHLAGEFKGLGKDLQQAMLQSAYDGALLVHARNQALSYLKKPDLEGHAKVTTFTTDGTFLNLFAHYAAPDEEGSLRYHQSQLRSISLTDSLKSFKEGRTVLRNAQDHAYELSRDLRDQLKKTQRQPRKIKGASLSVASGTPHKTKGRGLTRRKADKTTQVMTGRITRPSCRQHRYHLRSSKAA